jgi:stage III sporulation protein AD
MYFCFKGDAGGGHVDIIQVVGIGLITAVLVITIKEQQPLFAFLLATFVGVAIFLGLIGEISKVIRLLENIANKANIHLVYLETILKIIGIAYIAEFGAQITRDAGQSSIAAKIELAGKILIMVMAIPIITVLVETIMQLLPGS